jgi:hypothetical protein
VYAEYKKIKLINPNNSETNTAWGILELTPLNALRIAIILK